jgi:hypothetical protein
VRRMPRERIQLTRLTTRAPQKAPRCPAVRTRASSRCRCSQARCSLVPQPPRERPSRDRRARQHRPRPAARSARRSRGGRPPRADVPARRSSRPTHPSPPCPPRRPVPATRPAVGPRCRRGATPEQAVDGLPTPVPLWYVPPRRAGPDPPPDPVDQLPPAPLRRTATAARPLARRQQRLQHRPLPVAQVASPRHRYGVHEVSGCASSWSKRSYRRPHHFMINDTPEPANPQPHRLLKQAPNRAQLVRTLNLMIAGTGSARSGSTGRPCAQTDPAPSPPARGEHGGAPDRDGSGGERSAGRYGLRRSSAAYGYARRPGRSATAARVWRLLLASEPSRWPGQDRGGDVGADGLSAAGGLDGRGDEGLDGPVPRRQGREGEVESYVQVWVVGHVE